MSKKRRSRHHHHVYVVELDPAVLNLARFRKANPERDMLKPMPYEAAREMEVELAIGLREEGYAVWQA